MKVSSLIISTIAVISLIGCGKKAKQDAEDVYELQGNYQTKAKTELTLQAGGIGCIVRTMDITLYKMTLVARTYDDAECQGTKLGDITYKGSYSIAGDSDVSPGARKVDLQIDTVTASPANNGWATIFAKDLSGDCRLQDVPVGNEKRIEGVNCGVLGRMPAHNQYFLTTFKIEGNDVLFTKFPNEAPASVVNQTNEGSRANELNYRFVRQ